MNNRIDKLSSTSLSATVADLRRQVDELKNRQRTTFINNVPMYMNSTANGYDFSMTSTTAGQYAKAFTFTGDNQALPIVRYYFKVWIGSPTGTLWTPTSTTSVQFAGVPKWYVDGYPVQLVFNASLASSTTIYVKIYAFATDTGTISV